MPEINVEWTADALDDLEKLDPPIQKRIVRKVTWFSQYFSNQIPEPLSGEFRGTYKLRIGDWRVIYQLEENIMVIRALGHRNNIYKTSSTRPS